MCRISTTIKVKVVFPIESATEILANRIISDAIRNQATDIHIIPQKNDTLSNSVLQIS